MDLIALINAILILFILACAVAAMRVRQLLGAAFILSCFSFFLAVLWAVLGAVDVSFTEAVIGVGVSTIFILVALLETRHHDRAALFAYHPGWAFTIIAALAVLFLWGSLDMPGFGTHASPANTYLSPYYLNHAVRDTETPNVVTAILADYRGFDTLIETVVIFTAGISCLLVVRSRV